MSWQSNIFGQLARILIPKILTIEPLEIKQKRFDYWGQFNPVPRPIKIEYFKNQGIPYFWFRHAEVKQDAAILYFHGGGYCLCSVNTHRRLIAKLAIESKIQALGINYHLAPQHPFPEGLHDALNAYQFLLDQGIDPGNIAIAGDSAGGGLMLATIASLREKGISLPGCAVCFSPWTDLAITGETITTKKKADVILAPDYIRYIASNYIGEDNPRNPLISPLYEDLSGFPPLLIQVGSDEILLADSTRLAESARKAGVEVELEIWDGMPHVFQAFGMLIPEGNQAIAKAGTYIKKRIGTR